MLRIIVGETYICFSDYLFQQIKSLRMGGNSNPEIADLTLSVTEYRYAKVLPEKELALLSYNGDILIINYPDFLDIASEVYNKVLL